MVVQSLVIKHLVTGWTDSNSVLPLIPPAMRFWFDVVDLEMTLRAAKGATSTLFLFYLRFKTSRKILLVRLL